MTETKLLELLGKDKNSETVREFINSIEVECHYEEIDEESFYECKGLGFELKFNENKLVAVFLYGEKKEGFDIYDGEIPFGVRFEWSQEKIRENLGPPSKSGHAKAFQNVLPEVIWDRYDYNNFLMHISYASENCRSINKITLMTPRQYN